jgi:hypothetical protein
VTAPPENAQTQNVQSRNEQAKNAQAQNEQTQHAQALNAQVQRTIKREQELVKAMIAIYCKGMHGKLRYDGAARQSRGGKDTLCDECQQLLSYASKRLERCPQLPNKPFCSDCSIHCYARNEREQIKAVMRYAGPRMLFSHPIIAIHHLLSRLRSKKVTH